MSEFKVALRYSRSLLEEAVSQKSEDVIKADLEAFITSCDESREMRNMLHNPIIKSDKKFEILESAFSKSIDKLTLSFFSLVCKKQRASFLISMSREYLNQYNLYKNISKASIKTAISLNENLKKEFVSIIEKGLNKKVDLQHEVDEDVIGGFILKINDRQIDESIRHKLNQLKLNLIDESYKALV
jgi:F-type H+-transporting ATPase subunit delta